MKIKPGGRLLLLLILLFFLGSGIYQFYFQELTADDIINKSMEKEKKLSSYYSLLETRINLGNSSARRYYVEMWFSSPNFYRVEIFNSTYNEGVDPEQVIIFNGEKSWIFSPEIGDYYLLNSFPSESASPPFLISALLKGLSEAQELELTAVEKKKTGNYYILKVIPFSPGRNHAWEKVWLDKKTLLPVQVHIYDIHNRLQQEIIFHKTVLNLDLDRELFNFNRQ